MTELPTGMNKKIIQVDEQEIKQHLNEILRSSVDETVNQLLDEEAQHL